MNMKLLLGTLVAVFLIGTNAYAKDYTVSWSARR